MSVAVHRIMCLFVKLSVCLSASLPVYLWSCVSVCSCICVVLMSLYVHVPVCLSMWLRVYQYALSICVNFGLYIWQYAYFCTCLCLCMVSYLHVRLFVCLSYLVVVSHFTDPPTYRSIPMYFRLCAPSNCLSERPSFISLLSFCLSVIRVVFHSICLSVHQFFIF